VVLMLCSSGCRLSYVLHAAAGQYRLLKNSVPVEEALKKEVLSPEEKDRLRLVSRVKEFGEEALGLKTSGNYGTVYLDSGRRPLYVISACPKDRLKLKTWWFPVVGSMPYLGFFDLERAKAEREKLIRMDMDVTLGTASAYSTLGWFDDPVTRNLLEGSTLDLVETILHEMTHVTLYVKGQGAFNEGLAMLVGKRGALLFFEETFGPDHPFTADAQHAIEDERLFSSYLASILEELEALYDSPVSYEEKLLHREKLFARAVEKFGKTKERFKTNHFLHFDSSPLNNAYLLSIGLYHRRFLLFEAFLREKGDSIPELLAFFGKLAGENGDILARAKTSFHGSVPDS